MAYFLREKLYNPTNLSQVIKTVFSNGNPNVSKNDKADQIKKSILHVEFMYNELKGDYK